MLMPHQTCLLTVDDAQRITAFIEKTLVSKSYPDGKNYKKMIELGVNDLYFHLRGFVEGSHRLDRYLTIDPDDLATRD